MRMCVGCREMMPKRELLRMVKPPDGGAIHFDKTGKASGRGAYLCHNPECLKKARKTRMLEKMLEHSISAEAYDELEIQLQSGAP